MNFKKFNYQEAVGGYGTFWFYCCCNVIGVAGVFFLLPETKGKTLEEIERLFIKDDEMRSLNASSSGRRTSLPNDAEDADK